MEANPPRRWYPFSLRQFFTKRRRFRFSLRALLILVTLVSLTLGFFSFRSRNQRAAIARIQQLNGSFQYDYEAKQRFGVTARTPRWMRELVGDEYFQDVVFVKLDHTKVNDADLPAIGKLHKSEWLMLNDTEVSDDGLKFIGGMRELKHLSLHNTKVTSVGIPYLRSLKNLRIVSLTDTSVGDDTLPNLSGCSDLYLGGTAITSQGLRHLTELLGRFRTVLWLR